MNTLFTDGIMAQVDEICQQIQSLPLAEQVDLLNAIRQRLHEVSPFRSEPVDCVVWVPSEEIHANAYNPNAVAPPEMRLLERSIVEDGYTQPIVGWATQDGTEVVDGYHRSRVGKSSKAVSRRVHGYLPIAYIRQNRGDVKDRMAATIRHNRARGVHGVTPMTDIVADLRRRGWNDTEIAQELGMDADEVLRFKQNAGLPELFKNHTYSQAWE